MKALDLRPSAALLVLGLVASCDNRADSQASNPNAPQGARDAAVHAALRVDAGAPADRTSVRRTVTFYRWASTEPGDDSTQGQSIEHGATELHLVFEVHRDPQNHGWIEVGAVHGTVAVPESARMRPLGAPSATWHVPHDTHNEYSLEQFGGQIRADEPVTVALASAPTARQSVPVGAQEPEMVRLPLAGNTLPTSSQAALGQYDAIVLVTIPITNRHGGRYLVYALDLLPEPGGFAADGVMAHAPSASELDRYTHWMRDPHGMGRDRNPPIAMSPIDRS